MFIASLQAEVINRTLKDEKKNLFLGDIAQKCKLKLKETKTFFVNDNIKFNSTTRVNKDDNEKI